MDDRLGFIQWLIGDDPGYIGLGAKGATNNSWVEATFKWPQNVEEIAHFIKTHGATHNVYMCPTPLRNSGRTKVNVSFSNVCWADLDECPVEKLKLPPTIVIQTSEGRHQCYWRLNNKTHADLVEDLNRRIAYAHEDDGCDISGWDLTQMLRIPNTNNFKYLPEEHKVRMVAFDPTNVYDVSEIEEAYPQIERFKQLVSTDVLPVPDVSKLEDGKTLLEKWQTSIHPRVWRLFRTVPETDWSNELWNLQLTLFEIGVPREEVFVIARDAACNKFARDNYGIDVLWREVLRAELAVKDPKIVNLNQGLAIDADNVPDRDLLTPDEAKSASEDITIIDDYINWASSVTDAPPQYHVAGAFIILTGLLSGYLRLPTSYSTIIPNMWFMILADTTLTRKSTAMDLATEMLDELSPEVTLATDGTVEGIMQSMSMRPNMPSMFKRDEFSGLLDLMNRRDYYAGMLEAFTKLYDGKTLKRQLKKESIVVQDPIFIMFAGGIKERIYSQITHHHINSGFIPRFCFVTANADFNKIRPLGPPTTVSKEGKSNLLKRFDEIRALSVPRSEPGVFMTANYTEASMTPGAWRRFNELDEVMQNIGFYSTQDDLMTPMMARLSMSGLKAAMLIAASRTRLPGLPLIIEERDIVKAFSFVQQWKMHAFQVVINSGKSVVEKEMERVYKDIVRSGTEGETRSSLMSKYHLTAREADNIFTTLEQRGLIATLKRGKTRVYKAHNTRGMVLG